MTDLILIGALAAVWLAAGLLADTLPAARTARELRRRARALSTMVGAGAAVFIAVPVVTGLLPGETAAPTAALLPAVPALLAVTITARRLSQIRRGAATFATAPMTPAPPALRAAAAHPLVATPLQMTGLATLTGIPVAAGIVEVPGADVVGIALTIAGVAALTLAIRHAVRHSRLNLAVLAPIGRGRLRSLPSLQSRTETYAALPEEPRPIAAPATATATPTSAREVDLVA